jgi:hypothetical protein
VTDLEGYPDVRAGGATLYRLYDVGYEIDLTRAADLLAPAAAARPRPRRGEAVAIVTPRPPLTVEIPLRRTGRRLREGAVIPRLRPVRCRCGPRGPAGGRVWGRVRAILRRRPPARPRSPLDARLRRWSGSAPSFGPRCGRDRGVRGVRARGCRPGGAFDPPAFRRRARPLPLNEPRPLALGLTGPSAASFQLHHRGLRR